MKLWATIASAFADWTVRVRLHRPWPNRATAGSNCSTARPCPHLDSVGPSANWRVENGELVADKLSADKGTNHLLTKEKYKDFQIYLEFWSDEKVNSGLFIRCQDPKNPGAKNCYEVNIFDGRKDPTYGTGAIVYFAEVNPMPKAAGKWNTFEVTAKGRQITVSSTARRPRS